MQIENLVLKDFTIHKKLEIPKPGPVVGLFGPNGSGKSSVLQALEFLLTGAIVTETRQPMEAWVRDWGAEDGAKNAKVSADLVLPGTRIKLMRQFGKTPRRELEIRGEKFKRADKVKSVLEDVLGCSLEAISRIVFLRQGQLDKLLFGTESERDQLFAKILGISDIGKLADAVDARRAIVSDGINDVQAAMDEARTAVEQARERVREADNALLEHGEQSVFLEALRGFKALLEDAKAAAVEETEARGAAALLGEQAKEAGADPDEIKKLDAEIEQSVQRRETASEAREAARRQMEELSAWSSAKLIRGEKEKRRETLAAERSSLSLKSALDPAGLDKSAAVLRRVANLVEAEKDAGKERMDAEAKLESVPEKPDGEPWTPENDGHLEALEKEYRLADLTRGLLSQIHDAGADHGNVCPVCRQRIEGSLFSEEEIQEVADKCNALASEIRTAKQARDTWRVLAQQLESTRRAAADACDKAQAHYAGVCEKLLNARLELPDEYKTLNDPVVLVAKAVEFESSSADIRAAQERLARVNAELDSLEVWFSGNPEPARPDVPEAEELEKAAAEAEKAMQEAQDKINGLRGTRSRSDGILRDFAKANAALQAAGKRLAEATKAVDEAFAGLIPAAKADLGETTAEAAARIDDAIRAREAAHDAWNTAKGAAEQARASMEERVKRLLDLETREARNESKRRLVQDLTLLRSGFTRTGIPALYMRFQFQRIAVLVQHNLATMAADFTVEVDPDNPTCFTFLRLDGASAIPMPQTRMSGGQRVRLAVAFAMAVQQLLLPGLGFMALDEPSMHLDTKGVEDLRDLLLHMQAQLGNQTGQTWMADHRQELVPAVTTGVEFTPGGVVVR